MLGRTHPFSVARSPHCPHLLAFFPQCTLVNCLLRVRDDHGPIHPIHVKCVHQTRLASFIALCPKVNTHMHTVNATVVVSGQLEHPDWSMQVMEEKLSYWITHQRSAFLLHVHQ